MSFGFEVHHILPRALFNNKELAEGIQRVFNTGNNSLLDYHSNHINLFDNDDMANIMKTFSHEQGHKMDVANFFGSIKHKGSQNNHPEYNNYVIKKVQSYLINKMTDDSTKKYLILDLSKELTKALQFGTIDFNMSEDKLRSYFSDKLVKVNDIATLQLVNGEELYVFDEDKVMSKNLLEFEKTLNTKTFVSTSSSVVQTFKYIKEMLDTKYEGVDNITEYNSPYTKETIELLKDLSKKSDLLLNDNVGQIRNVIARLVSNEAISAGAKVGIYTYDLFTESKDINDKLIFAEKIVESDLFTQEQKAEAEAILRQMNFIRENIPRKSGYAYYQAGFINSDFIIEGLQKVKPVVEGIIQRLSQDPEFLKLSKINLAGGVADFVNNVYDGLIEGLATNHWDKFFNEVREHSTEAVVGTAIALIAAGAFSLMAGSTIALVAGIGITGTTVLTVAGLAAWGYMWYELTTKVINTDWETVYEGFMSNILKINELKDWFDEQKSDLIEGFADVLTQYNKWADKNSVVDLLQDYKEVLEVKEGNKVIFKHIKELYDENIQFMGTINEDVLTNTSAEGNHILYGGQGNDVLIGNNTIDVLIGGEGDDILKGNGGNDILGGNAGNDILYGGEGRDTLIGGQGIDIYHIDGVDTVFDSDMKGKIVFNEDINMELKFKGNPTDENHWYSVDANNNKDGRFSAIRQSFDLLIKQNNSQDSVVIRDFFKNVKENQGGYIALNITLEKEENSLTGKLFMGDSRPKIDGFNSYYHEWDNRDEKTGKIIDGIDEENFNDMIHGTDSDDVIKGLGGHDALDGNAGNDILEGGEGSDLLIGGTGADTMYGGEGNDFIHSSGKLQYYRYSPNDNFGIESNQYYKVVSATQNTRWAAIFYNNTYSFIGVYDTVDNVGDIIFGGNGDDIVFGSGGVDYIHGDGYSWENGTIIYETGNDDVNGEGGDDVIYGGLGNDKLGGGAGDDILYGGDGDDKIYGSFGNDVLFGELGNNILDGEWGFDRYIIEQSHFEQGQVHNVIDDEDKIGQIQIGDVALDTVQWRFNHTTNKWFTKGLNIFLQEVNGDLLVMNQSDVVIVEVKNFSNGNLGIMLNHINEAPTINGNTFVISQLKENQTQNFNFTSWFNDDSGVENLRFDVQMVNGSALPNWLMNQDNDILHIQPDFDAAGVYDLRVVATDKEGLSNSIDWKIEVQNQNRAPIVSGSLNTQNLKVGENWQYTLPIKFSDEDTEETEKLAYHLAMADGSVVPSWLSYNDKTQTLSGMADVSGSLNVNLIVTDPHGAQAIVPILLNIKDLPKPIVPVMGIQTQGSWGHDNLFGTDGNDTLKGLLGNDFLRGGLGNDRLEGGLGADTYVFKAGDGHDRLYDSGGNDTLRFEDVGLARLWFSRDGKNLQIDVLDGGGSVKIENYFTSAKSTHFTTNAIEHFQADGHHLFAIRVNRLLDIMDKFKPTEHSDWNVDMQKQHYLQNNHIEQYWQAIEQY